jgi:hypothetical protein
MDYPHAGHIFTPDEGRTWISDIRKFLLAHKL